MTSGSDIGSDILYGSHQRGDSNGPFAGMPKLKMDLCPQDCQDIFAELEKIQRVVDRLTGWDQVRPENYLPFLGQPHPDHDPQAKNVDVAAAKRQWQRRTLDMRWEIGILHTHIDDVYPRRKQNVSWSAANRPYQYKAHSYQPSDKLFVGQTLGEILGAVYAAVVGKEGFSARATGQPHVGLEHLTLEPDDQVLMPPGLYQYLDEII